MKREKGDGKTPKPFPQLKLLLLMQRVPEGNLSSLGLAGFRGKELQGCLLEVQQVVFSSMGKVCSCV